MVAFVQVAVSRLRRDLASLERARARLLDGTVPFNAADHLALAEPNPEVAHGELLAAVLDFARGRVDTTLYGAQAVNLYVRPERGTGDVDLFSTRARELAEEIRAMLRNRFHVAVRLREKRGGFVVYRLRKPPEKHRKVADVWPVRVDPPFRIIKGLRVLPPADLLVAKVEGYANRKHREKGGTDQTDIRRLLRTFPRLREEQGEVAQLLQQRGAGPVVLEAWQEFAREKPDKDDIL